MSGGKIIGATKRDIEKMDEYRKIAFDILIEIGAIKTCEFHTDFYYDTYLFDKRKIFALATKKAKEKYGDENIDFKEFAAQINKILNEASDSANECPQCNK